MLDGFRKIIEQNVKMSVTVIAITIATALTTVFAFCTVLDNGPKFFNIRTWGKPDKKKVMPDDIEIANNNEITDIAGEDISSSSSSSPSPSFPGKEKPVDVPQPVDAPQPTGNKSDDSPQESVQANSLSGKVTDSAVPESPSVPESPPGEESSSGGKSRRASRNSDSSSSLSSISSSSLTSTENDAKKKYKDLFDSSSEIDYQPENGNPSLPGGESDAIGKDSDRSTTVFTDAPKANIVEGSGSKDEESTKKN